ncbi:hypothetical protein [Tenacibaculum sp. SDUM215027]|uniref:hypothetical protein n=1 Tax=Tenacibaculum sp. SDUM215027 TaxID=3422596 RepID=UPI003D30FD7F
MKKSILNLGKVLNKADQKEINGGLPPCFCSANPVTCPDNLTLVPCTCNSSGYECM